MAFRFSKVRACKQEPELKKDLAGSIEERRNPLPKRERNKMFLTDIPETHKAEIVFGTAIQTICGGHDGFQTGAFGRKNHDGHFSHAVQGMAGQ